MLRCVLFLFLAPYFVLFGLGTSPILPHKSRESKSFLHKSGDSTFCTNRRVKNATN
nr:MAG TPA: hypothetical protein [Caudoviricetes sp.]